MRLELQVRNVYDGAIVHIETEITAHIREGCAYYYYQTACGIARLGLLQAVVDMPVTCFSCIATHQPGYVKCMNSGCVRVAPVAQTGMHYKTLEPICDKCTRLMNVYSGRHKIVITQE